MRWRDARRVPIVMLFVALAFFVASADAKKSHKTLVSTSTNELNEFRGTDDTTSALSHNDVDGAGVWPIASTAIHTPAVALDRNNLSADCSSRCSLSADDALEQCWLHTLAYFERVVVGVLRRVATTQTSIAIWQRRHDVLPNFARQRADALARLLHALPKTARIADTNRPLDAASVRCILDALFDDAQAKAEAVIAGVDEAPHALECPRACEKHTDLILWLPISWVFAISCAVTVCLSSFILVAIVVLERRESNKLHEEIAAKATSASTTTSRASNAQGDASRECRR